MKQIGRVEPFLGLTLGAVLLSPETISLTTGGTRTVGDTWRFASTLMVAPRLPVMSVTRRRSSRRVMRPSSKSSTCSSTI